jgi:hypothetical protein
LGYEPNELPLLPSRCKLRTVGLSPLIYRTLLGSYLLLLSSCNKINLPVHSKRNDRLINNGIYGLSYNRQCHLSMAVFTIATLNTLMAVYFNTHTVYLQQEDYIIIRKNFGAVVHTNILLFSVSYSAT